MNHTYYGGQYFRTCMYVVSCMGITHVMSEADWEGGGGYGHPSGLCDI